MERIVLIDFCRTVVNFQTFDPFLEYVIECNKPVRYRLICNHISKTGIRLLERVLRKLHIENFLYKNTLLKQMKGITDFQLEETGKKYYDNKIRCNLIGQVIDILLDLKKNGYHLMIVSGGSDWYIRYFANEFGVDDVLTARLEIVNGKCTGKMLTACMGEEKIRDLKYYMLENKIIGVFEVGLSDSDSDLPMLNLCKRKIVVSQAKHQDWVTEDMEEIVWN